MNITLTTVLDEDKEVADKQERARLGRYFVYRRTHEKGLRHRNQRTRQRGIP